MNLVFDLGNTTQKMAVLSAGSVVDMVKTSKIKTQDIEPFLQKYNPKRAILSSVVNETAEIADFLKEKGISLLNFSYKTPIPIRNEYQTPDTLGSDRLACAVAAAAMFPNTPALVLQMGTCITSDFVTADGIYKGGSISPGLEMRFKSLHHFSAKLPLAAYKNIDFFIGTSTEESILTGIVNGIIDECNGISARYAEAYPRLKIILTGGDAKLFENRIKNAIFTNEHLVLIGLNIILNYNIDNE
jgi:type III pantothenate kinase